MIKINTNFCKWKFTYSLNQVFIKFDDQSSKEIQLWNRTDLDQILAKPFSSYVILSKLPTLSKPQQDGDANGISRIVVRIKYNNSFKG